MEYELVLLMHGIPFGRYRWHEAAPDFYVLTAHGKLKFERTTKKYEKDGVVYWYYNWVPR